MCPRICCFSHCVVLWHNRKDEPRTSDDIKANKKLLKNWLPICVNLDGNRLVSYTYFITIIISIRHSVPTFFKRLSVHPGCQRYVIVSKSFVKSCTAKINLQPESCFYTKLWVLQNLYQLTMRTIEIILIVYTREILKSTFEVSN